MSERIPVRRTAGAAPAHPEVAVSVFPMHGQHKLSREGYRTRDGHMIEWFGRLLSPDREVAVFSRPEPAILATARRMRRGPVAVGTRPIESTSLRLPSVTNRRRWWVDSASSFRGDVHGPVVAWNPFISQSNVWRALASSGVPIVADLLDDWSIHYAFESVRAEVNAAYAELFAQASSVFANAEGTLELAHRFGRPDAVLLTNGCDPDRFSTVSHAAGPLTVGYVGKIGKRVDLDLVLATARQNRSVRFVFAGPILDSEYRRPLAAEPNIQLIGDVHYSKVPALLTTFDVGWVPHRVGEGEVGGDVIKTYEYRAAAMPVLTTPVTGAADRGLSGVHVVQRNRHSAWVAEIAKGGVRVERTPAPLPSMVTWENKAITILRAAGIELEGREEIAE